MCYITIKLQLLVNTLQIINRFHNGKVLYIFNLIGKSNSHSTITAISIELLSKHLAAYAQSISSTTQHNVQFPKNFQSPSQYPFSKSLSQIQLKSIPLCSYYLIIITQKFNETLRTIIAPHVPKVE